MAARAVPLTLALACLGLAPAWGGGPAAPAAATGLRPGWRPATFTWVKLVPREAGSAPNEHPAPLAPELLAERLRAIRSKGPGGEEPLFAADELAVFLDPLRQALAAAGPDEDVQLLSTYRRSGNAFTLPRAATVRLFRQGGALQVIVHDARLEFLADYYANNVQPAFVFGSRTGAGPARLACAGAAQPREDWVSLPLETAAPVPAPAAIPAPAPAAAPAQAGRPVRDQAFFDQQEQRLKAIKRLRDEQLISETEYLGMRQRILDEY